MFAELIQSQFTVKLLWQTTYGSQNGNIRTGMLLAPSINLHEEGTLDPSQLSF